MNTEKLKNNLVLAKDKTIDGIIWFHEKISFGLVWFLRKISWLFSFIPLGIRYAIGFVIASAFLFLIASWGANVLLLNAPLSLEDYPDRNANQIQIVYREDSRTDVRIVLYEITPERQANIDRLLAVLKASEPPALPPGEERAPEDLSTMTAPQEQLDLVAAISGIPAVNFTGASKVVAKQLPRLLNLEIEVENIDTGTRQTFVVKLQNPTEEQLTAATRLYPNFNKNYLEESGKVSADDLQMTEIHSDLTPVLKELFYAKNRSQDSAPSLNQPKICRNTIRVWETPPIAYINVLNADELDVANNQDAEMEIAFDNANTVLISGFGQIYRLKQMDLANIVNKKLDEINTRLKRIADRQNAVALSELKQEAEKLIRNHPDKRRLTADGKKNIRDEVMKKFQKVEPKFRKLESVKPSEISDWYMQSMTAHKINQDNLRYSVDVMEVIRINDLTASHGRYVFFAYIVAILMLGCAIISLVSVFVKPVRGIFYWIIMGGAAIFAAYCFGWLVSSCDFVDQVLSTVGKKELFDSSMRNEIWLEYFWYWLPAAVYAVILLLPIFCREARAYFLNCEDGNSTVADVVLCKTESGRFTKNVYWVTWYHFFFMLILPILVGLFSCVEEDAYEIPGGGGTNSAPQQVVVQKKKKIKKKKYILNPNSAIIFDVPPINDEEHLLEIDDATATQYTTGGMFGKGKSKGKPGWAGGMEDAKIRFIRLKYKGTNWDWNMGKGADYNMLIFLKSVGFNIAEDTEAKTLDEISRGFRKGKKPPFLYLTGRGSINLSAKEVKQLRDYLLKDGGMIFADNAGGNFDGNFRAMLRRVLPNHKLVDIANDDPLYQAPYIFPNGAPRFFHHSGDRALGIKNNGRWIVFYHQGDIGDAWKGAGLSEQQREMAFRMGANVISYAFGAYLENLDPERK